MIELERAKEEFINYTSKFDQNDLRIKGKIEHTFRVANICEKIAESINLTKEEIQIAYLIGLLHDIGRFEQLRDYDTFSDKEMDHAEYGISLLKKSEYIRKYIKNKEYDEIIYNAIKYHNKYEISKEIKNKELVFSKIIRDADKIDIFNEATWMFWKNEKAKIDIKITPQIYNRFKNNQLIITEDKKTLIDDIIYYAAMLFDINYKRSFEIIKDNNYINNMLDRFDFEEKQEIKYICNKYIEKQLQKRL